MDLTYILKLSFFRQVVVLPAEVSCFSLAAFIVDAITGTALEPGFSHYQIIIRFELRITLSCGSRVCILISAISFKSALGHDLVKRQLYPLTSVCVFLVVVVSQVSALALKCSAVDLELSLRFNFWHRCDGIVQIVARVGADGLKFTLRHKRIGGEGGPLLSAGDWFLEVVFDVV